MNLNESAPVLEPDTIVDDRYRVDCHVGRGAMGVVLLATEVALHRQVAPRELVTIARQFFHPA